MPLRTNTYAAPEPEALSSAVVFTPVVLLSSELAPTTTVSPDTATETPKLSLACVVPTAAGFR